MGAYKNVASFTDAWIETCDDGKKIECQFVASFTDAWIETEWVQRIISWVMSHLLQMRGLKRLSLILVLLKDQSHLLQMRGLKQKLIVGNITHYSRIFYRCVD